MPQNPDFTSLHPGYVKWSRRAGMTEFGIVAVFFVGLTAGFGVYGLVKVGYTFHLYGWAGSCRVAAFLAKPGLGSACNENFAGG